MKEQDEKKYLPLGRHQFYYVDDTSEIDYNFYLTWSPERQADVKVKKFGSKWGVGPTPMDLIHYPSGHKTFKACCRSWPEQPTDGFVFIDSSYKTTELVDELAQLIRGKNFLYYIKIYANKKNHEAFVIYHPSLEDDEDFQIFMNYVRLTR